MGVAVESAAVSINRCGVLGSDQVAVNQAVDNQVDGRVVSISAWIQAEKTPIATTISRGCEGKNAAGLWARDVGKVGDVDVKELRREPLSESEGPGY